MAGPTPAKKRTLYEILGVERDAMAIDIGVAYKKRLAELNRAPNPDPNELGLVREAYHILCQPREREAYDASLVTREEKAAAKAHGTDLILEADEDDKPKRPLWIWISIGVAVVLVLLFIVMRGVTGPASQPKPAVVAQPEAPKPEPPPPAPAPRAMGLQEIRGLGVQSVARLVGYEISGKAVPVGSGVLVAENALVSTCHALPPSSQVVARIGPEEVPAALAVTDEALDLCRFSIPKVSAPVPARAAEEPKAGDKVYAVAQHQGADLSALEGTVKAVRTVSGVRLLEISMTVAPGASGGALFDSYGKLVGVISSLKRAGVTGNVALPASAIAQMRTRGKPSATPPQ